MKASYFSQPQHTESTRLLSDLFNMVDALVRLSQATNDCRFGVDSEELSSTVLQAKELLEKVKLTAHC